jgi:predicted esterase
MRILGVCLLLLISVVAHSQGQPEVVYNPYDLSPSLRDQAIDALIKKDSAAARPLLERWLEVSPRDWRAWYWLAGIYAGQGDNAHAIEAFEKSSEAGLLDTDDPVTNPAFETIRSNPRFKAALDNAKTRVPDRCIRRFAPMRIEGTYVVMLPPDYEKSQRDYPLVVILHGNGSTELVRGTLSDQLGRDGVIYVAVRAPYPALGFAIQSGNPSFTAWPDESDTKGIKNFASSPLADSARTDYVEWIFNVADAVQKEFRVQKGRIFICGHSQGGQFANIAALLHPNRVASYLSQAGSEVPGQLLAPALLQQLKRNGINVWLVHGNQDTVVPIETSSKLAERLKEAGVSVIFEVAKGGHSINNDMVHLGQRWIRDVVTKR